MQKARYLCWKEVLQWLKCEGTNSIYGIYLHFFLKYSFINILKASFLLER